MRFITYFAVFGLCLLTGACEPGNDNGDIDIDIGDYENQLEAWNSQNMLDYQISLSYWYPNMWQGIHNIIVKNGIIENNDCSYWWVERGSESTIPEFYSLIKYYEKTMKDAHNSGDNRSLSLNVSYNTKYHYPSSIITKENDNTTEWTINLMPLEEGELDIDIGDYEHHLEVWNSRSMPDYQISIKLEYKTHTFTNTNSIFIFSIKNGIPDKDPFSSLSSILKEATVPEIFSFIGEEEERIRNKYNGINRPYLHIQYDTEYHYPMLISSGVDFFQCHLYNRLEITLTPEETE